MKHVSTFITIYLQDIIVSMIQPPHILTSRTSGVERQRVPWVGVQVQPRWLTPSQSGSRQPLIIWLCLTDFDFRPRVLVPLSPFLLISASLQQVLMAQTPGSVAPAMSPAQTDNPGKTVRDKRKPIRRDLEKRRQQNLQAQKKYSAYSICGVVLCWPHANIWAL